MEYIFQILCGMLYLFGLLFGWNYQETSVYVCIYAFPFLMLVPFVLTSARAFYIFLRGQRKTFSRDRSAISTNSTSTDRCTTNTGIAWIGFMRPPHICT